MKTLDDSDTWKGACLYAAVLGIEHGLRKKRPVAGAQLIEGFTSKLGCHLHLRVGHRLALRQLYGAAYRGAALGRSAKRKAW